MGYEKVVTITAKHKWYDLQCRELWDYRELIWIFVKRNYSTRYKQTILGPLWLLISPLFTMIAYSIVFGGIAGLSTDGVPRPLFYLLGNILWGLFSNTVVHTSRTFSENAGILGKVYFPRLIMPFAITITNLLDFFVPFLMLTGIQMIYSVIYGTNFYGKMCLLLPFILLQFCLLGMGIGIIISSMTVKYRDFQILLGFGLNIWMYATPVVYSITLIPEKLRGFLFINPLTAPLLIAKEGLLGIKSIDCIYQYWGISYGITMIIFIMGMIVFKKTEKNFLDTI